MNKSGPVVIILCAPSCSGKTTFINKLNKSQLYHKFIDDFDIISNQNTFKIISSPCAEILKSNLNKDLTYLLHLDINSLFRTHFFGYGNFTYVMRFLESKFSKIYFTILITSQRQYLLRQRARKRVRPTLMTTWSKFMSVYQPFKKIYPIQKMIISMRNYQFRILEYQKKLFIKTINH